MKRYFNFGKIDATGNGRKDNKVIVEVELRRRGEGDLQYYEFTASAMVWNCRGTDAIMGGQCLDEIMKMSPRLRKDELFREIHSLWKSYHLNGMNAGTPEQTAAVDEWLSIGNKYDYSAVCEMLKEKGLLTVSFFGRTINKVWNGEEYKYGSGWVVNDIPIDALRRIRHLLAPPDFLLRQQSEGD